LFVAEQRAEKAVLIGAAHKAIIGFPAKKGRGLWSENGGLRRGRERRRFVIVVPFLCLGTPSIQPLLH
jgi:hypothetical protein